MSIKSQTEHVLREAYGPEAEFREGQLATIEATLTNRRTLVVQKTGWGKSIIYYIAAKIIREKGGGVTLIISPLLELMNNQREAAERFGLKCRLLNSTIKDETQRQVILAELVAGEPDLFFTTPETLFRPELQRIIPDVDIGLFVIDEAHCLSDWGHDFRLEYSRLYKVIDQLPSTTPVLCTTATANDRVIDDLTAHLGRDIFVSRGDLMRPSLCLQVLALHDRAQRFAWILDHLEELPGTGIIYCLTKRDCDYLCTFLKENGVLAEGYYSDSKRELAGKNREAIDLFKANQIKVLVATVKLGMGYDKPDIGFVIHYQRPQNVVAYYQQIGRAGRNLGKAYAILMSGPEDEEILNYFIETAFPDEILSRKVLAAVDGRSIGEICAVINGRRKRINNALAFLEFEGYLYKENHKYYRVPRKYVYNYEHYEAIRKMRRQEMEQMRTLIETDECLLRQVVTCLNNPTTTDCGRCANCLGRPLISPWFSLDSLQKARKYIDQLILTIEPRLCWPITRWTDGGRIAHPLEPGFCLSKYGDVGYGEMVKYDKYRADEYRDELLAKAINFLKSKVREHDISALTYVPSLKNEKVKDFAMKLAKGLGLQFFDVIHKTMSPPQKSMENSSHQCQNALESYSIPKDMHLGGNVILMDDIVDSRWTLTVCGNLLGELGCRQVIPFCLADSSEGVTHVR